MKRHDFIQSESGSGATWSMFIFMCCATTAGVAIDGTNGMRAKEHLQVTADIAAHAGLIELANGGTHASIRQAAANSVESNMPRSAYGGVLGDTSTYVDIGTYTAGSIVSINVDPDNAVSVELNMSESFGTSVKTFLLGFVGLDSWDVTATGTAVLDTSNECAANDGIYAHGEIKMTSTSEIGPGFCIFSGDVVELSNHNVFQPGSGIGMPDLADCGHCSDDHNRGIDDAEFEANLQLESISDHIENVMASLLGTGYDTDPLDEFLLDTQYQYDLTPLADLNYQTNRISKGTIISISGGDFESMSFVPPGLIYAVYCSSPLDAYGALSPKTTGHSGGSSNANVKTLSMETTTGAQIKDVAIVTDCKIDFGNTAYIANSIVATSSTSKQSLSAGSSARIGSGSLVCPAEEKVVIMSMGDMKVPAEMETNNVDFYAAGDVTLAAGTSTQATKLGTSFYVDGSMHISAQGNWYACGDEPDSLTPTIEAIRHVIASAN